jgi:lipopolysaccharide export system permease protein
MKPVGIINRYLFREMIPPFVVNVVVLTFIFLMTRILEIVNLIVNYRVRLSEVLRMMAYNMPFFLQFVIPMAVMMAVLLTFLRMSSDNEIVALKAGGVGISAMLPAVITFGFCGALLTAVMAAYGLPAGRLAAKSLAYEIATTHSDVALKERTFIDAFRGVMLYVNHVDPSNRTMKNVFIEDHRTEGVTSTIVAPRGALYAEPRQQRFEMRLYDGLINEVNLHDRTAHTITFSTYDMRLDLHKMIRAARPDSPKNKEEMRISELRAFLAHAKKKNSQYYQVLMELQKKFAYPISCLVLGFLAMPLGIHSRNAKRSFGVGIGLGFFLLYYLMLTSGWVFGDTGAYPPVIGMWLPNAVMLVIGIYLYRRAVTERPVVIHRIIGQRILAGVVALRRAMRRRGTGSE